MQKSKCRKGVVLSVLFLFCGMLLPGIPVSGVQASDLFDWKAFPALPEPMSGHFAGILDESLVVLGGSNFPVSLFEGGKKQWLSAMYQLAADTAEWRLAGQLEHPLAYGVSISTPDGLICIGGSDGLRHYADVFRLVRNNGKLEKQILPSLPQPLAYVSGALLDHKIYVAGGLTTPNATVATKAFYALDLHELDRGWQALPPWPGSPRMLAAVAAQSGCIYLMGGCDLVPGKTSQAGRDYLTDAWCFAPEQGWRAIEKLPHAVVAGSAVAFGPNHILIFGGDDGANTDRIGELKDQHPGFRREILGYHSITDSWAVMDTLLTGLVTTSAVRWGDTFIIPGGEDRPGHRSAQVLCASPKISQSHFQWLDYIVLVTYLIILVLMGLYFSRREQGTDDFFLAGRRIPWWAAGLSIFGTQLSAITFMATPAKAFATDWVYFGNILCITLISPVIVHFYLPFYRQTRVTSVYEYLEQRFNLAVRYFGNLAYILFQLGRMAIVIFLPALALTGVTGFDIYLCILTMGIVSTLYTVLGGIEAVIWTDVLQVIILFGGALLSLILILLQIDGGLPAFFEIAGNANKFHFLNWTWDATVSAVWVVFLGNLLANLVPYTTDQSVVQRYLTTKTEKQAARSIYTNAFLSIPAGLLFFSLGTALFVFYKTHPGLLSPAIQTDMIFPWFIFQQLPPGVSGLVIAGLFAAAMSTLDSSLNSLAAVFVTDYYRRFKTHADDWFCLKLSRWITIILGIFATVTAIILATYEIQSLWDLFIQLLGLLGGSLAGVFALGIFTRRANSTGTLLGALVSAGFLYWVQRFTPIHFFLYAAIGIGVCFIAGYGFSLIFPSKQKSLAGLTIFTKYTQ